MKVLDDKNDHYIAGEETKINPMCECFCGFNYYLNDFNNLLKELKKFNNKEYITIIDETITSNISYKCIVCKKNINKTERFMQLKLNDEEKHLICKRCFNNNKINEANNSEFYCIFCNKDHEIISYEEFKGYSNCIIF